MECQTFLKDKTELENCGVSVPLFDRQKLIERTNIAPTWLHFGGGNLYRAFLAAIGQELVEEGELSSGIVVCETFDEGIVDNVYKPFNNEFIDVVMEPDGTLIKTLNRVTAETYYCNPERNKDFETVKSIFRTESLQLVTVTITEKGYSLVDKNGNYSKPVLEDMALGPNKPKTTMGIIASLLYERFQENKACIAMVSTDNFSKNGQQFKESIVTLIKGWVDNQLVSDEFLQYVLDEHFVSFPWTMIDRITPNPSASVAEKLKKDGLNNIQLIKTNKGTNMATFSNTEPIHYLVIEDNFPNGRPDLSKAGVILTDQQTVDKTDEMKVTTCLNPLHTTLAIFGMLLGYQTIAEEMEDPDLVNLIKGVGIKEGLQVVDNPKIIDPAHFMNELLTVRWPNKMVPDTPNRIATDTSQKLKIRFGETIKKYVKRHKVDELQYIPLVIAGYFRYLLGVDDEGTTITLSPDPLLLELRTELAPIQLGNTDKADKILVQLLKNENLFGLDLVEVGLKDKIMTDFKALSAKKGAVRDVLANLKEA